MSDPVKRDGLKALVECVVDEEQKRLEAPGAQLFDDPVPDPMSEAFAVSEAEREGHRVDVEPWTRAGAWKHRQFGEEVQLRNASLPHLALDLYRAEAEELYAALAQILAAPMVLPYRLSRWERFKQWWLRVAWKRREHAELAAAREAMVEEFTRKVWNDR